ncbi:hypothetical protein AZ34_11845 [Hylemonella gracilis str. Niagara R]|uniref:Phage tail tape measure protein n=2 Tax=Hylemonella gracilis TaxID=80880 RepID=A0A016XLB0_9BURK|nr:hypothetical protein AZ34_11845 [Hylemonella gracilis str. Niagara R]
MQKALKPIASDLATHIRTWIGTTVAIWAGVGAVTAFANQAVNSADKVGDLAARYQLSARSVQVYGSLVEEAGGSVDTAAKAMGRLRKAMNEAVAGDEEQRAAFAGVGLGVEELRRLAPDEVMLRMADAFKASDREGQKNAVLLKVMGEEGTVFMDVMNQGGAAYRRRLAEMRADGSLLSREQLDQADAFDKSWSRLMRTITGVKNALGLQLANALGPFVDQVQKWVSANRGLIQQKFDTFLERLPGLLESARRFFVQLATVADAAASVFARLVDVLGPVGAVFSILTVVSAPTVVAFVSLIVTVGKLTWAVVSFTRILPVLAVLLRFVWGVLAANPIAAIIMVVATLAMVVYNNFGKIVDYISGAWKRIKSVFEIGFFDGLFQLWLEGWQAFGNAIIGIIKAITPDFLLPESFKNFQFTFATDRANRLQNGEEKSLAQMQAEQPKQQFPLTLSRGPAAPTTGGIFTAAQAAQAQAGVQRQAIQNTIRLQIDGDGRPKVKEISSGSANTKISVGTGHQLLGAL